MQTEGIIVDKIEVVDLAQVKLDSFNRTEETFQKPYNVNRKKRTVFKQVTVSFHIKMFQLIVAKIKYYTNFSVNGG